MDVATHSGSLAQYPMEIELPDGSGTDLLQAAEAVREEYRSSVKWKKLRGRSVAPTDDPSVFCIDVGEIVEFDWTWEGAVAFHRDGLLLVEDGHVVGCGEYEELAPWLGGAEPEDLTGHLITPGFVDTHIHFPQVDVIAAHGKQLLDWLEQHTFPAEAAFADPRHAADAAAFFENDLRQSLMPRRLVTSGDGRHQGKSAAGHLSLSPALPPEESPEPAPARAIPSLSSSVPMVLPKGPAAASFAG